MNPTFLSTLAEESQSPWTLWSVQSPLSSLREPQAAFSQNISASPENCSEHYDDLPDYSVTIHRPQYTAILDRMNKANRKTGQFTNWNT